MLALGVYRGRVMLVDSETWDVRWNINAHSDGQSGARVALAPDGRRVASLGFNDDDWRLWDAATGAAHTAGATHNGMGACICVVGDGGDREVQEGCPVVAHSPAEGLRAVALSPCGRCLASGGFDGLVILWDAHSGDARHRMLGKQKPECPRVRSLSFSADGARLASASQDAYIQIWEVSTGVLLRSIQPTLDESVLHIHFSPTDRKMLAAADDEGAISVWDVESGEKIRSLVGSAFSVFSPDGRTIATAVAPNPAHVTPLVPDPGNRNRLGDLLLIDVETGATRVRIGGHTQSLTSAAFSVDGSKLATGSRDGTCKVWDSSTGALLRNIDLRAAVTSVAWGRDWVRDRERGVAFGMGHHPRLGVESQVLELEVGVVRMILDRV